MDAEQAIKEHNIQPDPSKDQHLLVDEKVIKQLIDVAQISKDDFVLDVGAGTGNITKELAKVAQGVIAVEIDSKFQSVLSTLPSNTQVRYETAQQTFNDQNLIIDKIVANPPFQVCESLMHYACQHDSVKTVAVVVPESFAKNMQESLYSGFFTFTIKEKVKKESFLPQPDTSSVILLMESHHSMDIHAFMLRALYFQRTKKLKNALEEGLIDFYRETHHNQLTKRQSKDIIEKQSINELLAVRVLELSAEQLTKVKNSLKHISFTSK